MIEERILLSCGLDKPRDRAVTTWAVSVQGTGQDLIRVLRSELRAKQRDSINKCVFTRSVSGQNNLTTVRVGTNFYFIFRPRTVVQASKLDLIQILA
jgi:hypothetical protein